MRGGESGRHRRPHSLRPGTAPKPGFSSHDGGSVAAALYEDPLTAAALVPPAPAAGAAPAREYINVPSAPRHSYENVRPRGAAAGASDSAATQKLAEELCVPSLPAAYELPTGADARRQVQADRH